MSDTNTVGGEKTDAGGGSTGLNVCSRMKPRVDCSFKCYIVKKRNPDVGSHNLKTDLMSLDCSYNLVIIYWLRVVQQLNY